MYFNFFLSYFSFAAVDFIFIMLLLIVVVVVVEFIIIMYVVQESFRTYILI